MRQKFARALRKWADLIDPRVKPTSEGPEMTISLRVVGREELESEISDIKVRLEELVALSDRLKEIRP